MVWTFFSWLIFFFGRRPKKILSQEKKVPTTHFSEHHSLVRQKKKLLSLKEFTQPTETRLYLWYIVFMPTYDISLMPPNEIAKYLKLHLLNIDTRTWNTIKWTFLWRLTFNSEEFSFYIFIDSFKNNFKTWRTFFSVINFHKTLYLKNCLYKWPKKKISHLKKIYHDLQIQNITILANFGIKNGISRRNLNFWLGLN